MNSAAVGSPKVYVGNAFPAGSPVRILAAIDFPDDSNSDHNERIVRQAARLAERAGGELHVAATYSIGAAHACRIERYLPALRIKARDRRRLAIRRLLRRLKITHAFIHVEEGESPHVIDALASSLQAVVVGDAAHANGSTVMIDGTRPTTEDVAA